jgi:hypothetical protein
MVREFEEATEDTLLLVVDPWLPQGGTDGMSAKGGMGATGGLSASAGALHTGRQAARGTQLLEDAISLAATVAWEWCRQKDRRLTLAVANPAPIVVDGITGREHALRMLEALAGAPECAERSWEALRDCLKHRPLPAGPILAVSAVPSELGNFLAAALQRPVTPINAAELDRFDFYERPVTNEA